MLSHLALCPVTAGAVNLSREMVPAIEQTELVEYPSYWSFMGQNRARLTVRVRPI